jgi:hypothetical protein
MMVLAMARCPGIKDLLLGELIIPKSHEEIDETTDEGKKLLKVAVLNELAFIELVLSIDVRSSRGILHSIC